ncbi:MAG: FAD-binding oxidoreductase [Turicibacter sp.]|nr:FAD-binding oxidoreductase [Turicibacter sp.]
MKNAADIVIIGGGISGVAIGYFLLKYGAKNVVILERDFLGAGATGKCGAGIRQQWGASINCIMTKFSCEFFENAAEELGCGDVDFHQGGYMLLISTEKELEQTKKNIVLQNSLGIESVLLSPQEAGEMVPLLDTSKILAATFHRKDGFLSPFKTTQAFAKAFERLGGTIYKATNVTGIDVTNGRVTAVKTDKGTISTNIVMNAAGGYAQQIAKMVDAKLPLYSERHNILVTEQLERTLSPMLMSFSLNLYMQQAPSGGFIMGRTCANQPRDLRVTADSNFPVEMARTVTNLLPKLGQLRMLRQWAGLYNMSPDKSPVYDEVPETKGFYVAAGYSGHGFMLAPATGQAMAEIILGLSPTLPWDKLGLSRFSSGNLIVEPSVV